MTLKFTKKTNILLIFLLILTALPITVFAQDGTQTYTTEDGLSFDYPEGWGIEGFFGQVFISNTDDPLSGSDPEAGEIFIYLISDETMTESFGDLDDLDLSTDLLGEAFGGELGFTADTFAINDVSGIRYDAIEDNLHTSMFLADVGDQGVMFIANTQESEFASFESTILEIVGSMRFDGAEPTGGTGGFADAAPAVAGEGVIVWQQQFDVSENIFNNLGQVSTMSINNDVAYVSDGLNIAQVDADGNVSNFVSSPDFMFMNVFAAADDGSLWVGSLTENSLLRVDEGLNTLNDWSNEDFDTPVFGEFLGVQEIGIGPDGDVYMFTARYDESFNTNGTIMVWSDGEYAREFSVQSEDSFGAAVFSSEAHIAFTPDGNIVVVDGIGSIKIVDTDGNVVKDDFPSGYETTIGVVNDVAVMLDGTIVLATYEGIKLISPEDGSIINTFGTAQDFDAELDGVEFEMGQFSSDGPSSVAVLSDGSVLVLDSNNSHNLVMKLDFSAAE